EEDREAADEVAKKKAEESKRAQAERAWQEYIADMQQIANAWEAGDIADARKLLTKHIPKPGGVDYRGLEWYYWHNRLQQTGQSLPEAKGRSAAFNKDGTLLAMANEADAMLWDVKQSSLVHKWKIENPGNGALASKDAHGHFDHSVAISPNGKYLAATN